MAFASLICIRNHDKVWKFGLCHSCCFQVVVRDDDHANVLIGKLPLMALELTELDHAEWSPMAAKEDHDCRRPLLEFRASKRSPVGEPGGKLRNFAARLSRSCVCRTLGPRP